MPALIPASGGTFSVVLTTSSTCGWAISVSPLLQQFLSFSGGTGQGPATIRVTVAPHTGLYDRTIEFVIAKITVSTQQSKAEPPVIGSNAILFYSGNADSLTLGQAGVATTGEYTVPYTDVNGAVAYRIGLQFFKGGTLGFFIILEAANGQTLAPGLYLNAQNWAGGNQPHPVNGMTVAVGANQCSYTGQFEIFDIAFDAHAKLQRLHAQTAQHCTNDAPGSSLTIQIWYPSKGSF